MNFEIFSRVIGKKLHGSRDANHKLSPDSPDEIVCIQESRPRKFIPRSYPTIHAERKTWTDTKSGKGSRRRSERERDAAHAIFFVRVVKQQKIINHRDFYTPARGDKFNNLTTTRCFSKRDHYTNRQELRLAWKNAFRIGKCLMDF